MLMGPAHVGVSPNYVFTLDILARHAAYVMAEAVRRAGRRAVAVEPTEAAWTAEIAARAGWMAPVAVCGPSYMNDKGAMARLPPDAAAAAATYPLGVLEYADVLRRWRDEGSMEGLTVSGGGPSIMNEAHDGREPAVACVFGVDELRSV